MNLLGLRRDEMTEDYLDKKIRLMKIMYILTIVVAGGMGVAMLVAKAEVSDAMGFPRHIEPLLGGVAASVYFSFGALSLLGYRAPLKFAPVLLLQLTYKVTWFIAVILPLVIADDLPDYAPFMMAVFAVFVIGDLFALPFKTLFNGEDVKR